MSLDLSKTPFRVERHTAGLCIVGGGMAGICASVAAARRGAQVVLVQDRPVLGGNASSEIGVHIIGADRIGKIPYLRETGILEELRLANLVRNPQASLSMWDLVVYDLVRYTPNLTLLLNCSCLDADIESEGNQRRIRSITGWQLSTQTWHQIEANLFADCSGDAVLAPLTGAEHIMGREAAWRFKESNAPAQGDDLTMGMSYIFYTREHDRPMPFKAFDWARKIKDCDALPWGAPAHSFWLYSPWWCELGGEHHSIHDSEILRDELFRFTMGIWDHIKNDCEHSKRAENSALEKIQFVPGRRESRRYVGAHMLTQNDVESGGAFEDTVCHGGWTLDMHHPGGADSFAKYGEPPTEHHPAPAPYGIPYRCLYGHGVKNLMFAGRVASCSHVAMSSTRVMGTCAVMGQALGTAAAYAVKNSLDPAGVLPHIQEVQQQLLADDVFLPGFSADLGETTRRARLEVAGGTGDPETVRDGFGRPVSRDPGVWMRKPAFTKVEPEDLENYEPHGYTLRPGDSVAYHWPEPIALDTLLLLFDSNLERSIALRGPGWQEAFPGNLPKNFRVEVRQHDRWETVAQITDNACRQLILPMRCTTAAVRFVLEATHGGEQSVLYTFAVNPPHLRPGHDREIPEAWKRSSE